MKQVILKDSFDLGWGSHSYHVALGGNGETGNFVTFGNDSPKCVIPLAGTFSNLSVYSPAGLHPSYTVTLLVNGVASTLACVLASTSTLASDVTHSVAVIAGDDVSFLVDVNPFGAGVGYTLNLAIEFEGTSQWYGVVPCPGGHTAATYNTGGALGNGIQQSLASTIALSNTYSICSTAGTITGMRMKAFAVNAGGSFTAYLIKNQVLQDGSGGTVNTSCNLVDGIASANNAFSLAVAVGDHLDFALLRNTTNAPFASAQVAISCIFTPTDTQSFMCCGGSNNANLNVTEYRWVHSEQDMTNEDLVKCPISQRGITITGLRAEIAPPGGPGAGKSITFTVRKNEVDTAATVTVADLNQGATITGLTVAFVEGDFIDLKAVPFNSPTLLNGMWWGLALTATRDTSGLYTPNVNITHDKLYGSLEKKIPNPTIRTALIGE